jgi:4'-phosphopantetheinyl transferase
MTLTGVTATGERAATVRGAEWVRVVRVDLAVPTDVVAAAVRCLSPSERVRAERGTPPVFRRRVLVRAALRAELGEILGTSPGEVPLVERDGRPELAPGQTVGDLDANCSASADLGLVAVACGARVGVDIERLADPAPARAEDPLDAAVDEGWLAPGEVSAIRMLSPGEREVALSRCWTQKEAVLKGDGVGLRIPPSTVVTPVRSHGRSGQWKLLAVDVPDGYVASLALRSLRADG